MNEGVLKRRSIYKLGKAMPVGEDAVERIVKEATALVPDAFNMKSQRVVLAFGAKHEALWDAVQDAFGGKVPREKIDGFKAGSGTVLYFYDEEVVKSLQEKFPQYAANFPVWAQQSNAMLQLTVWTSLREVGVGANIQHYNPVIDDAVHGLFGLPENYILVAQMPFGGIVDEPPAKPAEDISRRVRVVR